MGIHKNIFYFFQDKESFYEHQSMKAAIKFISYFQSNSILIEIVIASKEFESIILVIIIDDVHDLLTYHFFFFIYKCALRCKVLVKAHALLK